MNILRLFFTVGCAVLTAVIYILVNDISNVSMCSPIKKNEDAQKASHRGMNTLQPDTSTHDRSDKDTKSASVGHSFKILWYNPPYYIRKVLSEVRYTVFSDCEYKNCEMSFDTNDSKDSDAVIFDGRQMKGQPPERPLGQVWIFSAHESPLTYNGRTDGQWKDAPWRHSYNWTMTYNAFNTDLHLPYGIIKRKPFPEYRNYTLIASNKNDSVLMVSSNCESRSKRLEYVNELRKYINVTVLGACGTRWNCGRRHLHDDCFDLLNTTYKFYLAFENAMCTQYFSEKVFANFNYDIILVVRGGKNTDEPTMLPNGTYISAQSFKSAKDLGLYLKTLSESREAYSKILERKSMYYSLGLNEVYTKTMCNLCKRMNFQNKYKKMIPNIEEWAFEGEPCRTV